MANCKKQQLNITCGTDVVLHDRLIFDGETFDPALSTGIAANLVNSLANRTPLEVEVADGGLIIYVPWEERNAGYYGLEVTGICNMKKWATYADALIRYTRATEMGMAEVTTESDYYDITQEVGFRYSTSPISSVTATIDDEVGTPSVDVEYDGKNLEFDFHSIKGEPMTFDDLTAEQKAELKGDKGDKGNDGVVLDPEATTIFDDMSDLAGKTDEQKHKMLPSGNTMELLEISDSAEIPSSSWIRGSIRGAFGNTYNQYGSWDYMYFIPIEYSSKVIITAAAYRAYIGFVTNTTQSNGGAVPYAEGETGFHTIEANATATFNVPSDAKYIVCAQKTGENWAYPSKVVCVYSSSVKIEELRDYTDAELAKKQDKRYLVDLSTVTIVAGYDDINTVANDQRTTLRMQRVFKGDVFKVIKPSGVPTATGTMLVRTFSKAKVRLAQTGWVSSYTIQQDGYVTIVVNSGVANGGTTQFLLDALSQSRVIEVIAQQYIDERWADDDSEIIYNRVLQSNNQRYFQFTGQSPYHDTLRCNYLKKLLPNQSMAIYDGIIFLFTKGAGFRAYDYYHLNELANVSAILATNAFECNAMWFSNEFYDPADRFPIVYGQAIYTTPYICGFRIQEVNGVWSITKVHEIYFSGVSGVGNLIALNQRDDTLVSLSSNLITFQRPKYSQSTEGVSTLTQEDVISTVAKEDALVFGQDCSMLGDICVGINNVGSPSNAIFGINVKTGKTVFHFTPPSPWDEGEGIEWYCGRLYASDVNGNLYEIIFP